MPTTTTTGTEGRVWVAGPDDEVSQWLGQALAGRGCEVSYIPDVRELRAPLLTPPDIVLLDARVGPGQAADALASLQASPTLGTATAILLLPQAPDVKLLDQIIEAGSDYLIWPVRGEELASRVMLQLRRARLRGQPRRAHEQRGDEPGALQRPAGEQRELNARLRQVFEQLPVGVMLVSVANQIELVNEALCRFLGYEAAELVGRQPGFMVLPEDHAATTTVGYQLAAGQIDHFVHDRRHYVRKDGSLVLGKLTCRALRDDTGRTQGFLAFIEDIGARVVVEDELARYTRYQQALTNASLSLLAVAPDVAARTQALERALQQLVDGAYTNRAYLFRNVTHPQLGLALKCAAEAWNAGQRPLHELSGARVYSVFPYAVLPAAHRERLLAPLPAGGLVEELYGESPELLAVIKADGIRSTQTVPVLVDGAHWGFVGFDDHTRPRQWDHIDLMLLTSAAMLFGQALHRWQVEDDLRATTQFLHTTGRVARVGGWALDLDTRTPTVSDELAAILEVAPGTALDLDQILAFFTPESQPTLRAAAEQAIRDGGGWEQELSVQTARGRRLWVLTQGQAEQQDGRTVRLFGTVQDVTRRKEAELRLERQLRIEAGLTRCSQELLAPVSSEDDLRRVATPALEHLRVALEIDQVFLMRLVPDAADPYLTMAAFATVPVESVAYEHPLGRRFPLALLPPAHRQLLEAGRPVSGLPKRSEVVTPAQHAWLDMDLARTRITFPVRVEGTLWGVLGFNGLEEREWGEKEQTVLGTAAEMLGHVIRRWSVEQELRRSEEQFRAAVETMLDGFAIFDSVRDERGAIVDFRYRYINEVGCQLNQRTREEQLGRTLIDLLPAHRDSDLFADYIRLVETGAPVVRESLSYEDQYGSGERLARVFDVRAARLGDGFAVVWRDVTDRRLAHQSLAQANDDLLRRVTELRTLNQIAQTLAFTHDLAASLETVCTAMAGRTGAARALVACYRQGASVEGPGSLSEPLAGTLTLEPERLGAFAGPLLSQRRGLALSREELPADCTLLAELPLADSAHLLLVPLTAPAENIGLLILSSGPARGPFSADDQSLAETVASQIATAITNVRLAEQARRAAMLAERSRLARELHDSATQSLYSLSLLAGGWAMQAERGHLADVPAKLTQLGGIALQVLKELRLLIYQLRHPELEAAGLIKALEERLAAVEQRASVRTSLAVSGDLAGLSPDHEEQLYAILQEVLNNALRHAQARTVAITVRAEAGQALFTVRDDGVGFDPTNPSAGLGLRSMRERAAAIGARLTVTSQQGQGTLVEVQVALAHTGDAPHG